MMNDEQFTCLVRRYIDTVFRVALNYLKNPADAEDVTQITFEKLLKEKRSFESDEHVRNWLIRVAVNECKKLLRSPWRKVDRLYCGTRSTAYHSALYRECARLYFSQALTRGGVYIHSSACTQHGRVVDSSRC